MSGVMRRETRTHQADDQGSAVHGWRSWPRGPIDLWVLKRVMTGNGCGLVYGALHAYTPYDCLRDSIMKPSLAADDARGRM